MAAKSRERERKDAGKEDYAEKDVELIGQTCGPIDPAVALQSGYLNLIKSTVLWLDPYLRSQNVAFKVAVVLIGAAFVGPSTEKLVAFTGYSRPFIAHISRRMHGCGLWANDRVVCDWLGADNEWIPAGLWLQVLVAEGAAIACRGENGEWKYRVLKKHTWN
jgi:hypothetical protein